MPHCASQQSRRPMSQTGHCTNPRAGGTKVSHAKLKVLSSGAVITKPAVSAITAQMMRSRPSATRSSCP
jgi:hypothetical protein